MRLVGPTLVLAVAACGAAILGCGGDDSGPPVDGSTEGNLPDSGPLDAPVDAAGVDGPPDSLALDAPSAPSEAAPNDASGDGASLDAPGDSAPDATVGTVVVTVDASLSSTVAGGECAGASSLAAAPNDTTVGHSISLTASGLDSNNLSTDVSLTWSATGDAGALTTTTGPSNSFTCAAPGTETVTVTAAMADGGASCPQTGSLTVSLTCDAP